MAKMLTMTSMLDLPDDPKKLRARLRRYERKLAKEKHDYQYISDGAGKRYFLGPLYMLLDDLEGALRSFTWFEREFPDDCGDPGQYLCWALALRRAGHLDKAASKLRGAMFQNRYTLPKLLGLDLDEVGIVDDKDGLALVYLEGIPHAYYSLWADGELEWAAELFDGRRWVALRARSFEIEGLLEDEPPGPTRNSLVEELFALGE